MSLNLSSVWRILATTLAVVHLSYTTKITRSPSSLVVEKGKDFKVECGINTTDEMEGVRIWHIVNEDRRKVIYQSYPNDWAGKKIDKDKIGVEKLGVHDVKVTFRNATFHDAGRYDCEAILIQESNCSNCSAQIVVVGKPSLTLPSMTSRELLTASCELEFLAHKSILKDSDHFPVLTMRIGQTKYEGTNTSISEGTSSISHLWTEFNTSLTEDTREENITCLVWTSKPAFKLASSVSWGSTPQTVTTEGPPAASRAHPAVEHNESPIAPPKTSHTRSSHHPSMTTARPVNRANPDEIMSTAPRNEAAAQGIILNVALIIIFVFRRFIGTL